MSDKQLSGSLALTRLVHVVMEKKGKGGKMVKGLFIPIEANMLIEGKPNEEGVTPIYMPINVRYKVVADERGQNGFVSKTIDSKTYKAMTDAEKEASKALSPILGNIKDFSSGGGAAVADTKGDVGQGQVFNADSDDDLPF